MKKLIWVIVIIIVILLVIFTGRSDEPSDQAIKIGQASTLTGVGADIGEEERNGALLALEQINSRGGVNGKQLEMISADMSQLSPKDMSTSLYKLVNIDSVTAVVGPQWDMAGAISAALSKETQTVFVSPNVSPEVENEVDSDYLFSTWYSDESGIKADLQFMKNQGYKKVAVIQPTNGSFWGFTTGLLKEHAADYGIEIVSEEYGSDFSNMDYRTLITKSKESEPDVIFGSYSDLTCTFLQQLDNQGLNIPFVSTSSSGNPVLLENCPELLENRMFFSTPRQGEKYKEFERMYEERFGVKPTSPSAITSYDAMLIVAKAIEETNSTDSEKVREYIANTSFTDGLSLSKIEFDQQGFVITPEEAFEIRTVRNGQFVPVE